MKLKNIGFLVGDLGIAGGGERVVCSLANYLVSKYNVHIYHFGTARPFWIDEKINVHDITADTTHVIIRKLKRNVLLRRKLIDDEISTLIAFGWQPSIHAVIAVRGLSIKLIVSERNNPFSEPSNLIWRSLRNWAYKKADYLVCQTEDAREYFSKRASRVILNPLKSNLPNCCLDEERTKTIINFCRLHKQKNLPMLINGFKIFSETFPDYKLIIYGEGELRDELIKMIDLHGLKDTAYILPFESNIHERIKNAGIFVSSSDYEGLSNSMLEAMALGIPSVVTDCPVYGARMVIENGVNGLLIPMNDPKTLAEVLIKLASDDELRLCIGKEGSLIRDKLSINSIGNQWIDIIEQL